MIGRRSFLRGLLTAATAFGLLPGAIAEAGTYSIGVDHGGEGDDETRMVLMQQGDDGIWRVVDPSKFSVYERADAWVRSRNMQQRLAELLPNADEGLISRALKVAEPVLGKR